MSEGVKTRVRKGASGSRRVTAGASRWPRPEAALPTRTLIEFLKVIRAWKEGKGEPIVGRVKEDRLGPFAILVATVLSLRTRDTVTEKAFGSLWRLASTPVELLDLPLAKIEAAIRPVGFYKTKARSLKAIARLLLDRHEGQVPAGLDTLLALPGVGRKTANLVRTEGFDLPGICVDTHVHRILNWWGFVETASPDETEQVLRQTLPKAWWIPINGLLVSFGQALCKPVGPRCGDCSLRVKCPYPGKRKT